ncbi:hypothetical protein [Saccharibacillus deserti]|uniref:hypothetical protein n=1 Tax=Saccharibacillus deserti TaxID=1634444 RepID=UPI0015557153|nr:hypothetical protein [Saccharibacillus deserti]
MSGVFMPNPNDPRVIRTRRLLIDAFGKLLHHKDFNQIIVLDVAREATMIGWSIYGLTYLWHREGQRERPEERAARASDFVMSGASGASGSR